MNLQTCFIEPLDVLFLRGNKLFGDPGSYGESLVPPWPSIAAGALRSRLLAEQRVDLSAFAQGRVKHPTLGTPNDPGSFAITNFQLALCHEDKRFEALYALPADLVVSDGQAGQPSVSRIRPVQVAVGLQSSCPLPLLPVIAEQQRGKPASGYWLRESGWRKYLAGVVPGHDDLIHARQLWTIDPRIGIGLDAQTRRAADGQLFSMQAIALLRRDTSGTSRFDVGFIASVSGADLPSDGILRFGGDGRAAAMHAITYAPVEPEFADLIKAGRCRLILTAPGLFPDGWRIPGCNDSGQFYLEGIRGRLVCATVPRSETVSGWDLARHQPKPAQRVAPTGSVYWLDELEGTPEALERLVHKGLWNEACDDDAQRRAEGFNRLAFAAY